MEYEFVSKVYEESGKYEAKPKLKVREGKLEFSLKALEGQEFSTPYVCH